ncbi:hypothetical protein OF83DRAFT_1084733 [Amylostereum chailletii]|nr:hypothetical protein OF83DRAFT_1084733 [Amylostereum chailletii]
MVNWQDPATILAQYTDQEAERAEVDTDSSLVSIVTGLNLAHKFNCQAWLYSVYCFSYAGLLLASTLIGIRVIAIWNRNRVVIAFVSFALLAFLGTLLHGVIVAKATYDPVSGICVILRSEENLPNGICGLVVDVLLLGAMLVGLFRRREASRFGVWKMLWKQGLVWMVLATVAELPSVIFLSYNFNVAMNLMFLTPEMTILLVGATRMYRQLSNFLSPKYAPSIRLDFRGAERLPSSSTSMSSGIIESGISDQHLRRRPPPRDIESSAISMVPLEVSVHRVQEEHGGYESHDELKIQRSKDDVSASADYKTQAI